MASASINIAANVAFRALPSKVQKSVQGQELQSKGTAEIKVSGEIGKKLQARNAKLGEFLETQASSGGGSAVAVAEAARLAEIDQAEDTAKDGACVLDAGDIDELF